MTNPVIPTEDIEAAYQALDSAISFSDVEQMLEAAAPYIRAAHMWDTAQTERPAL